MLTNIEIKAKCSNHDKIREILNNHRAILIGIDHQIDTYFKVANGRLKLREGTIENYLIYYKREDIAEPKKSDVILYATQPGTALKEILTKVLGILVVVDKQREIYFIDNVKFHIDTVKDLGTFIEIEAIDTDGKIGIDTLRKQCDHYLTLFDIRKQDLVSTSYSDLLLQTI
ncbi:MAG: class IV adenylate cyclase [bacterium]|nr:class IV adenylate cyclase [bacterium]